MRRGREGNGERKKRRTGTQVRPLPHHLHSLRTTPRTPTLHPCTPGVKDGRNDDDDTVIVVWGVQTPCKQVSPPPPSAFTTHHGPPPGPPLFIPARPRRKGWQKRRRRQCRRRLRHANELCRRVSPPPHHFYPSPSTHCPQDLCLPSPHTSPLAMAATAATAAAAIAPVGAEAADHLRTPCLTPYNTPPPSAIPFPHYSLSPPLI
jgi:hypothetical protein